MHSSVRSEKNLQYIYVINLKDPFKKKILKQRPTKSKVRPVFPQNWGRKRSKDLKKKYFHEQRATAPFIRITTPHRHNEDT